MLYQVIASFF